MQFEPFTLDGYAYLPCSTCGTPSKVLIKGKIPNRVICISCWWSPCIPQDRKVLLPEQYPNPIVYPGNGTTH